MCEKKTLVDRNDGSEWRNIPGEMYDWTVTKKSERPYKHDYSKALVMKLLLSVPDGKGGSKVYCKFEQALEIIKKTDVITLNIHKIIYLVGWQYNGHDDKYPSWSEVNELLKRDGDVAAVESLKWLMDEAFKYNTTVSLHINMTDAYKDSPLWNTYVENDLISKMADGSLKDIGTWNEKTAYQVFYKNEWEKGFTVKRIDELADMLPLQRAGTVHIDAFFCRPSEGHGVTVEVEQEYRRKILRYWMEKGIDVTSEFIYRETGIDDLVGLQPMAWWFNQSEEDYLQRPAELFCGGQINSDLPGDMNHGFLFGVSMHGEDHFGKPDLEKDFMRDFCTKTLPWYYLNCHKRLSVIRDEKTTAVCYSDDLTTMLPQKIMEQNGLILNDGDNLFIPLLWKKNREIVAYSNTGYQDIAWKLPENWKDVSSVDIYKITIKGPEYEKKQVVSNLQIKISIDPGVALLIMPSGRK